MKFPPSTRSTFMGAGSSRETDSRLSWPQQKFSFHRQTIWHITRFQSVPCIPLVLKFCLAGQFSPRWFHPQSPTPSQHRDRQYRAARRVFVSVRLLLPQMRRWQSSERFGLRTNFVPSLIVTAAVIDHSVTAVTIVPALF